MPTQITTPIAGILEKYETALTGMGYSYTTKLLLLKRADQIIRRHEDHGLNYINPDIISEYSQEIEERYFNGKIQKRYYRSIVREIQRFVSFAVEKNCRSVSPLRGSRQNLTPEFERIAVGFVNGDFHPNTRCDIRWTTYKYFSWLEGQGYKNLADVGAAQIQKFLLDCSKRYAPSSIHNIRLYLKKLYTYLYKSGQAGADFSELLSFTVNRENKVFPALPKSDIAKLLDAIDRTSVSGKRNYAIMMLGTVLGLRACDIIKLKLDDIDWKRGEIKILQSKTANTLVLPMTQDVGESIQDYILNARPKSDAREIFLRICAPHTALSAAVTVGEIYEKCCKNAGIPASKRFHNLRRSLGTSMVSNGISVYDVAQVLGDKNVESTKPYLTADREHLKMCALSLDGIRPLGGDVW